MRKMTTPKQRQRRRNMLKLLDHIDAAIRDGDIERVRDLSGDLHGMALTDLLETEVAMCNTVVKFHGRLQ